MAPPKTPPLFKVRKDRSGTERLLTEKEIIDSIAKRKYTGEEEISAPPYERWQKLSSYPTFYDGFLRRLFDQRYCPPITENPPQKPGPKAEPKQEIEKLPVRQKGGRGKTPPPQPPHPNGPLPNDENEEDHGKTKRIATDRAKNAAPQIDTLMLNDLFSDSHSPPNPLESSISLQGVPEESLGQPLDYEANVTEEESPQHIAAKRRANLKSRVLWSIFLVGTLVLLFEMGTKQTLKEHSETPPGQSDVQARSEAFLTSLADPKQRMESFILEGDALYAYDTHFFYQQALLLYESALSGSETNPKLLGKIAETSARLLTTIENDTGKIQGSVERIQRTIAKGRVTEPHASDFYRAEALIALSQNRLGEAQRSIQNALQTNPADPENRQIHGEILKASGNLKQSQEFFEAVLMQNPTHIRAQYHLALVSKERGDLDKAGQQAENVVKLAPLHVPSLFLLANIHVDKNRLGIALRTLEEVTRLSAFANHKLASQAYLQLAKIQDLAGQNPSSMKSYRLSYHYFPRLPETILKRFKPDELNSLDLQRLALESEYGKAHFTNLAENLAKADSTPLALFYFRAASLLDRKDGKILVRLGDLLQKTATSYAGIRAAMFAYQRAIEREPSLMEAYLALGALETDQYNFDHGYKLLSQAAALSPESAKPHLGLAKHWYRRQDCNEARKHILLANRMKPADSQIYYYGGLIRLCYKLEATREALDLFSKAYRLDPFHYEALVHWVRLLVIDGQRNFALKFIRNLQVKDQSNAHLLWALGEVFAANQEHRRAIDYFHRALDANNRAGGIRMALARSLTTIGDLENAADEFRMSSLLDSRNGDGFYNAFQLWLRLKKYNEAEEVIKLLIDVSPNYPGAHSGLASVYQGRGQKDLAIASMQHEVSNHPIHAKFRIQFAEMLLGFDKPDRAIEELTHITRLPSPKENVEYTYDKIRAYLLLSRCYRKLEKFSSAEGAIRVALEMDNKAPELNKELGYVLLGLQRDKEAAAQFQIYLERNPAAEDISTIKMILQQIAIEE